MGVHDRLAETPSLVVDDIPEQLDIAVWMLSRLGYRVASAAGGEEAVAYIQANAVDLLVLDYIKTC